MGTIKATRHRPSFWIAAFLATMVQSVARSQDAGGASLQIDVAPGLSYTTDSAGEDNLAARTDLTLAFSSQTRTSVLDLSFGTRLLVDSDGDTTGSGDPSFRLAYARESRDAAFSTDLRYRRFDLGEALFLDPATLDGPDVLRLDQGTRTDLGGSVTLVFGRTSPFGGSLTYSYDRTDYQDTIDPDLLDSTQQSLSGQLDFRIDDRITARLGASQSERDVAEGGTDRTEQSVDLGLGLAVTPVLNLDASVGFDRVELREPDGTRTEEGVTGAVSLARELPNGAINLALDSRVDSAGRRTSLRFGRGLELNDLTTLGFTLGVSQQDAFGLDPVVELTLSRDFKRGALNASVTQSFTTTDLGESVRNTNARLSWAQSLTRTSGVSAAVSLRDRAALSDGADDVTRLDLNLAYNQSLTEDWDAVASYVRSTTREDGAEDRTTNSLFLGVQRSFDWRF